jgi:hypothetical protein
MPLGSLHLPCTYIQLGFLFSNVEMLLHLKNLKKNIANIISQTRAKLHELKENKYCIGIVEEKVGMRNIN